MIDLGCQDTDLVNKLDGDILDAIFLGDGFILVTLNVDKGKYGYLGCLFGRFGADLGCQDTAGVRGRDGDILDVTLLRDGFILMIELPPTTRFVSLP